jgi:hypothetical protein
MATLAERILEAIRFGPLNDDVLASRLEVNHRQAVNQAARGLEAQGRLQRFTGGDGKIVNALRDWTAPAVAAPDASQVIPSDAAAVRITEDEVKEAVRAYLSTLGFDDAVAWGRVPGIDIYARHTDGRRYVIEAKAEVGKNGAQKVNYFIGMLGELVQRMDDANASYGIALPDNRQYRGLVERLPGLAKDRLHLSVFWVSRSSTQLVVQVE